MSTASTAAAAAAVGSPQALDTSMTQVTPCKKEEDAPPGAAVAMPSVYDLLHARDWEALKKRAESHPDSMPADFIAQLFVAAAPGPSPEDFEWFMTKFGASADFCGFGEPDVINATQAKLIPYINAQMTVSLGLGKGTNTGLFNNMTCSIAAISTLNCFMQESRNIREDLVTYLFEQSWKAFESDESDILQRKWVFFKDCLEIFSRRKSQESGSDLGIALRHGGEICVSHTIIFLIQQISEFGNEGECLSLKSVFECLKYVKKQQPDAFIEKNKHGQTLLDLVLNIDVDAFESLIGEEEDAVEVRYKITKFLVDESPELARIRNDDDELPMHVVLKMCDRDSHMDTLISLLYKAAPRSAETRCLSSGLYPFQIAALRAEAVRCCSCYSCADMYHKARGITVGSVYMLLRECSHLIAGAISTGQQASPEGNEAKKIYVELSDESAIDIAKEELYLSRRRLEFERLSKELVLEEEEVKTKKRKLMQESCAREINKELGEFVEILDMAAMDVD